MLKHKSTVTTVRLAAVRMQVRKLTRAADALVEVREEGCRSGGGREADAARSAEESALTGLGLRRFSAPAS
jgi:hypothetical protein